MATYDADLIEIDIEDIFFAGMEFEKPVMRGSVTDGQLLDISNDVLEIESFTSGGIVPPIVYGVGVMTEVDIEELIEPAGLGPDKVVVWAAVSDGQLAEISLSGKYPLVGDTLRIIDFDEDPKPIADFEAIPLDGIAPFSVSFTDKSLFSPVNWEWDFGDGHTSTQQNPTHVFALPGKYTIFLTVYTYTQTDSKIKHDYILAGILDFNADQTSGPVKLKCRFNAEIVLP